MDVLVHVRRVVVWSSSLCSSPVLTLHLVTLFLHLFGEGLLIPFN